MTGATKTQMHADCTMQQEEYFANFWSFLYQPPSSNCVCIQMSEDTSSGCRYMCTGYRCW